MWDSSKFPEVRDTAEQRKLLDGLQDIDPRDSKAFKDLDVLVSSFTSSFPHQFTQPVKTGRVDALLYSVLVVSHL